MIMTLIKKSLKSHKGLSCRRTAKRLPQEHESINFML
jgi:hypothetical protein